MKIHTLIFLLGVSVLSRAQGLMTPAVPEQVRTAILDYVDSLQRGDFKRFKEATGENFRATMGEPHWKGLVNSEKGQLGQSYKIHDKDINWIQKGPLIYVRYLVRGLAEDSAVRREMRSGHWFVLAPVNDRLRIDGFATHFDPND